MRIAILTFDGFNEIDSFVAAYLLNRLGLPGWKAEITCPTPVVESARGVRVSAQQPLEFVRDADVVLVGSGRLTPRQVEDEVLLSRIPLDPRRQLVGSQCSGALFLAKLGLLDALPACTDRVSRPLLEAAGVRVLEQPFFARGNVATAGGCLASQYLATWVLWRLAGRDAAEQALSYVVPVGEESEYISRALRAVGSFIDEPAVATAG
ncbi:MAG TPA: DJ-1/PfpI family protein [Myxococcaceae bacterium]|jgi:transcriptional regulator GlxA family with amidase domain|nr:DJ-1/PfpI family protein [Myxococcaceae bacterium]